MPFSCNIPPGYRPSVHAITDVAIAGAMSLRAANFPLLEVTVAKHLVRWELEASASTHVLGPSCQPYRDGRIDRLLQQLLVVFLMVVAASVIAWQPASAFHCMAVYHTSYSRQQDVSTELVFVNQRSTPRWVCNERHLHRASFQLAFVTRRIGRWADPGCIGWLILRGVDTIASDRRRFVCLGLCSFVRESGTRLITVSICPHVKGNAEGSLLY